MIPLSRVLAKINDPNSNRAEIDTANTLHPEEEPTGVHDGAHVSSPWNPTGDIFDLRPDLAHMPIAELAGALLQMRQLLRSHDETMNRLQLMRFERQYSNALWRRAQSEQVDIVTINGEHYRLLLTGGMDVVLLPVS